MYLSRLNLIVWLILFLESRLDLVLLLYAIGIGLALL